jgi:gluconolactonase
VLAKEKFPSPHGGRLLHGLGGFQRCDSLAVDAEGNVCLATLMSGAISVIAPDGTLLRQVMTGDVFTTNICFGGPDLRTAYLTLSERGELVAIDWPVPGLKLAYNA